LKHAPEPPIPEISFESDTEIESDPWACPIKTEIFGELK
jgi:hypothetical protein